MNEVRLTIDDQELVAPSESTLLSVCQEAGIEVPTLCYHKALPGYGACRLCLVEVERGGGAVTVEASCIFPASEGLVVRTDTDRVLKARGIMAELLLARCPNSEKVKEVAAQVGVEETRFPERDDDCILCGLCTRVCSMLMHSGAIDFRGRGHTREVAPAYDKHSSICMACGACAVVCPTGAVDLEEISARPVRIVGSDYDAGLVPRSSIYIPYQQAIPKIPVIDRSTCMHFLKPDELDACRACESACPAGAIDYTQEDELVDLNVGAVVLAPGFCLYDAAEKLEMGYAWSSNVITSLQFERLQSASGPHEGAILRPSDGKHPKRIAFVQCVGSRDFEHNYCSSVCCMYATKEAIIAKEHDPDLECTIFYMDMRAYGKGFDAYFERAKELGVRYVRCRPSHVEEVAANCNLLVHYEAEDGSNQSEEFDLTVLSVGLRPPQDAQDLAEKFGIKLNGFGFADTTATSPVLTSRDGVYVCGPFAEPKDIPETVMEASAAAANAMTLLAESRGTQVTEREYPPEKDVSGQPPRIGVFVCHCGKNIGGVVDVPSVAEHAKTLADVVYAEDNLYTCSSDTQERICQLIEEHDLNRVIVASCTPRTHEPLFRDTVREAGLNPYLFEMANIRDHCSWVHMHEKGAATEKAHDLVRMAVAKARLLEPLQKRSISINNDALVVGGGVSGMTAGLNLADQGFKVHLVEREDLLGGALRKVRTLQDGNSPVAWLEELTQRTMDHANMNVYLSSSLTSVDGSVGNFSSVIARNGDETTVEHGAVIVAIGAEEGTPSEYLYAQDPRVMTQLEFEETLETGGEVGSRVVMIQCVGSRDDERPYCSRICCSQAVKNALRFMKQDPSRAVTILYRDIRTYGMREDLYTKARELGVRFVRYEPEAKPEVTICDNTLKVSAHDPVLGRRLSIEADTIVLAPPIVPPESAEELAQMLKVPLNVDRFFLEAHMKLRPIDFATDGVFLCGMAHSPKLVGESVSQAMGAAARAATLLSSDELELEATISEVIDANCDGCAYCIEPCPYNALTLIEYMSGDQIKKTVQNNPALCKGCGVCMATCPKLGIFVWHFKPDQINAMVDAALGVE